jgi:hypothetical protein
MEHTLHKLLKHKNFKHTNHTQNMDILFKQTALKHIQFIHTSHSNTKTLGLSFHFSHRNFGDSGSDFTLQLTQLQQKYLLHQSQL